MFVISQHNVDHLRELSTLQGVQPSVDKALFQRPRLAGNSYSQFSNINNNSSSNTSSSSSNSNNNNNNRTD